MDSSHVSRNDRLLSTTYCLLLGKMTQKAFVFQDFQSKTEHLSELLELFPSLEFSSIPTNFHKLDLIHTYSKFRFRFLEWKSQVHPPRLEVSIQSGLIQVTTNQLSKSFVSLLNKFSIIIRVLRELLGDESSPNRVQVQLQPIHVANTCSVASRTSNFSS